MKILLLVAGTAAIALAAPAVAQHGGGHGGMGGGHAMMAAHGPNMHASMAHGPSGHANSHATTHARHTRTTRHLRNAHATTHRAHAVRTASISSSDQALAHKYGGALCPPGLFKKTPACIPPGQAKRLFRTGQLVPTNYKFVTPFSDIPTALVSRYSLSSQNRYIYRNNMIYVINPSTNRVTQIINAVL